MELTIETQGRGWSAEVDKLGRRGDNEQGEEVWEVSSSPKPAGGPEEGSKEGVRSKMLTRSKELVPGLGLEEGKHVDECVWECRATDQWVTLQKERLRGDLLIRAANTKEWLWFQLGASNRKQVEILKSTAQRKYAWELVVRHQQNEI